MQLYNVLAEFYYENSESKFAKKAPKLTAYLNDKFKKCVVLVLEHHHDCYGYTANNITKFIRAESLHGASDNRNLGSKILHDYIFQKNKAIGCEFQISWNYIVGSSLQCVGGHLDTDGVFIHDINLYGNEIKVGLIESVILAIAFEFWQINTRQQPEKSEKCVFRFSTETVLALG